MAQRQVSDDGKYVRSRHALMWISVAFIVGALSSAFAIGIFRIGGYQSAIDAGPSAVNGSASRLPVEASRRERSTLVWEGARVSVLTPLAIIRLTSSQTRKQKLVILRTGT